MICGAFLESLLSDRQNLAAADVMLARLAGGCLPALLLQDLNDGCGVLLLCRGITKLLEDGVPQDLFRRRPPHGIRVHHRLKVRTQWE